jgi:hypothetical protein
MLRVLSKTISFKTPWTAGPGPHQAGFGLNRVEMPSPALNLYSGVGLGVAVADGITCGGAVTGVALGSIAGVAFTLGVAVADGVASCGGVPVDAGTDGAGVATELGVGLGFGCMFIAFLSASLPSGPNTILMPLFWLSLAGSCGTATAYCHSDPTNLSPALFTSQCA